MTAPVPSFAPNASQDAVARSVASLTLPMLCSLADRLRQLQREHRADHEVAAGLERVLADVETTIRRVMQGER